MFDHASFLMLINNATGLKKINLFLTLKIKIINNFSQKDKIFFF